MGSSIFLSLFLLAIAVLPIVDRSGNKKLMYYWDKIKCHISESRPFDVLFLKLRPFATQTSPGSIKWMMLVQNKYRKSLQNRRATSSLTYEGIVRML